jgi:toxin ParE1/3/4
MSVIYSRRALRDLDRIRAYIAQDNPHAASRMAVRLLAACDHLEQFPTRGRPGIGSGTRELTTIKPYVIVYQIKAPDRIEVLSIWHGLQDRGRS